MRRKHSVHKNHRFQEIRRKGNSVSNKLVVVCVDNNHLSYSRFGFSVSKRIGNAVVRNRVKRRLKEAVRQQFHEIQTGKDIVFIARSPIKYADYQEIDKACARLLRRANLLIVHP